MESLESLSFEEAFRRLEETVRRLEEGGLPLDESIALYEEGMELARRCQKLLEEAELKVRKLQPDAEEGLRLTPFETKAEE